MNNNPLLNIDFLELLNSNRNREVYARIIALSFAEEALEQIEGIISSGSINIDGNSAVCRTCSLTMNTDKLNLTDYYWGIKNKFRLEIGIKNTIKNMVYYIDPNTKEIKYWKDIYPQDIIWFPQGTYAITTFNPQEQVGSYSISISGKDKMCFLNGELGGSLNASIDFGREEYYDKETNLTTYTSIPIKKIIQEILHTYAQEPYHNIIINDLDMCGVELLEYRGDVPMYLLYNIGTNEFINFTLNGKTLCRAVKEENGFYSEIDGKDMTLDKDIIYDTRVEIVNDVGATVQPTKVHFPFESDGTRIPADKVYQIARVEYGQTVGYRRTDLTYPGDLISKVGESITSILDKIKKMLGEYEYFYDVDGRFVFQRKKIYLQNSWYNIVKVGADEYVDNAAYTSAVTYKFKGNDLITSFSNSPNLTNLKNDFSVWGQRNGISGIKIPVHYRYAIDKKPKTYISPYQTDKENNAKEYNTAEYDWRELIYQMALDHYAHNQDDDYIAKLIAANPDTCANGVSGYYQYYTDILGFWRDLYDPEAPEEEREKNSNWLKNVFRYPDQLNFWFDFLDIEGELDQFSVKTIGARVKTINDNTVTAIYYREVPNLIFTTAQDWKDEKLIMMDGYTPIFITSNLESLFSISAQGKSAQEQIDELLYNYSYCINNVTIQMIPIYNLQPNTRIYVCDDKNGIDGDYIVSKITLPLTYNGTMSVTAIKAPQRLI